jgi:hypothetical protein
MTIDTLPVITDAKSGLQDIAASIQTVNRKFARIIIADTASPDAIYEQVAQLRQASQAFSEIVDGLCRHCFPLPVTPLIRSIIGFVIRRETIVKLQLHMAMLHNREFGQKAIDVLPSIFDARYFALDLDGGRETVYVTATGKAAWGGIFWARAE